MSREARAERRRYLSSAREVRSARTPVVVDMRRAGVGFVRSSSSSCEISLETARVGAVVGKRVMIVGS